MKAPPTTKGVRLDAERPGIDTLDVRRVEPWPSNTETTRMRCVAASRGGGVAASAQAAGLKSPAMLEVLLDPAFACILCLVFFSRVDLELLQSLLQVIINDEESLDAATRTAAIKNWMRLFDGRWNLLQRMLDDYPGLLSLRRFIRSFERC
jgi:hypothetical protein